MANSQKKLDEMYDVQNAAQQAQQKPLSDVGTVKMPNASQITQSYYQQPTSAENFDALRPTYAQSQAVQDAAAAYQQHAANKPGPYQGKWNDQIQSMINNVLNQPDFSYDFSTDPLYQQYAQQYQRGGKLAMKDAMAQSAALTGGYGNSYAQQVGQQTYQRYMEDLSAKIPELRNAAYAMYQDKADAMRGNLNMLQGQDDRDYGRYRDTVGDWQTDLDMLYGMYNMMSEAEYNRYLNDAAAWEADRSYWYQKAYDQQQQANYDREFLMKYGDGSGGGRRGGNGDDDQLIEALAGAFAGEDVLEESAGPVGLGSGLRGTFEVDPVAAAEADRQMRELIEEYNRLLEGR